jgi:hypothetical protein
VTTRRAANIGYRLAQIGALAAALGGLVDTLVPKLLPHHEAYLGVPPGGATLATSSLLLLLLHTLGAALIAVGIGTLALLAEWRRGGASSSGLVAAGIFLVAEGMNAWAIWRVGSLLFVGPLVCVLLVVGGVALARSHEGNTARGGRSIR